MLLLFLEDKSTPPPYHNNDDDMRGDCKIGESIDGSNHNACWTLEHFVACLSGSPSHRISQFRGPGEWLGVYPCTLKWVVVFFCLLSSHHERDLLSPFFWFLRAVHLLAFLWPSLFFKSPLWWFWLSIFYWILVESFFLSFIWQNSFTLLVKRKACSFKYHVKIVSVMS